MEAANSKDHFDALFTVTNVPHILEKIFFSLDYGSYEKCFEVNSAWNQLLTSEIYQRKARCVFHEEILRYESKLVDASREGKAEEVMKLLSSGIVDLSCGVGSESEALHIAALWGRKNVVKILIDKGADPKAANKWGQTPLRMAITYGKNDVVQLLLDKGADPNEEEKGETHLLFEAILYGHKDIVQTLLEGGAEPNWMNKHRGTPLHWAAVFGRLDVVKVLLDGGANCNLTNSGGYTPYEVAARKGRSKVAQLLSYHTTLSNRKATKTDEEHPLSTVQFLGPGAFQKNS